jgi:hypothetical protein
MAADQTVSLGATQSYPLPGVVTLIRVEPHLWSRDASGAPITGCFRSSGIYLPAGVTPDTTDVTPPSDEDTLGKWVGGLTVVSLLVGTVATLASWGKR